MANGKAKWQIWQCVLWAIFDIPTSYGGLKVSEFNQEFNSVVKNGSKLIIFGLAKSGKWQSKMANMV